MKTYQLFIIIAMVFSAPHLKPDVGNALSWVFVGLSWFCIAVEVYFEVRK